MPPQQTMEPTAGAIERSEESFARIDEFSRVHVLLLPKFDRRLRRLENEESPEPNYTITSGEASSYCNLVPDL